jgi:hypothetical protein
MCLGGNLIFDGGGEPTLSDGAHGNEHGDGFWDELSGGQRQRKVEGVWYLNGVGRVWERRVFL